MAIPTTSHRPRRNQEPRPALDWHPKPTHTVRIVTIIPSRRDIEGDLEPRRSLMYCQKIAATIAKLPGVIWVGWSRSQVHVVMDVPAGDDVWAAVLNQIRTTTRVRVELEGWVDENPLEWDQSFRTAEKLAREAIGDRHQCGGATISTCGCGSHDNEKSETPSNSYGFKGGLFGPGPKA